MLIEKDFSEIPSFIIVKERIHAENPDVEIVRVKLDQSTVNYVFELMNGAGLRLSKELLDDLPGKNNDHRNAQLDQKSEVRLTARNSPPTCDCSEKGRG